MEPVITFAQPFKRVIQLELNEISKHAIDRLIARRKLPHFSQINQEWFFTETTSESQYEYLEPWIQWISAHTGKFFHEHRIFHLSDGVNLKHPQIWETLSQHGIESCIVGSMNAIRGNAIGGFFFPDPWAKQGITHPESIQPLWNLLSKKVQSHATNAITLKDLLQGFHICRQFRLPLSLYRKIAFQLLSQTANRLTKWKLPGIFDLFLAEIFNHLLKSSSYRYYTLFLNAVAHYQHHYWRHFESDLFHRSVKSPDCRLTDDPMTYGYELYDRTIQLAIELAKDPQTLVIIASGLSQEPFTQKEHEGGMNYYRLYHHVELMKKMDLTHYRVLPLMSRDWQIEAIDGADLNQAGKMLSQLTVLNQPLFNITQNTKQSLFIETAVTQSLPVDAMILHQGQPIGLFKDYFHHIAVKSGHHKGTGCLWLSQRPQEVINSSAIPLTQLYPLTLAAFGITSLHQGVPQVLQYAG